MDADYQEHKRIIEMRKKIAIGLYNSKLTLKKLRSITPNLNRIECNKPRL